MRQAASSAGEVLGEVRVELVGKSGILRASLSMVKQEDRTAFRNGQSVVCVQDEINVIRVVCHFLEGEDRVTSWISGSSNEE